MAKVSGESSGAEGLAKARADALAGSKTHLAGAKLRKQLSGSFHEHASAPTSDFAKKQLEKMGWSEGTGLGKKRDGIVSHIKVVKRKESSGLGTEKHAVEAQKESDDWWKSSFGDTLAKLGAKNKKGKKRERKEYTDEELFEATGGARFGMRAGKSRNQAKWKRAESDMSSDTTGAVVVSNGESAEEEKQPDDEPLKKRSKKMKNEEDAKESADERAESKTKKKDKKKSKKKEKSKREKRCTNEDTSD